MFNYGSSPLGGAPIPFSFRAGEDPFTSAYESMEDEARKRRMGEMMRLAGYNSMQYSTGADGGGFGMLGGRPQSGNSLFGVNPLFNNAGSFVPSSQPMFNPRSMFGGGGFTNWSTPAFPAMRG
jgi:hypothetical protein